MSSGALSITIDTTAPQAPTVTGDDNTNDTTPTVSGTTDEDAALVQVLVDGVANGNPVAVVNGEWTFNIEGPLAEGTFAITAVAIDAAGNESQASEALSLTVDLSAPNAPADIALDENSVNGISDIHTNIETPTINGTTDADTQSVEVFVGGQSVGFAEIDDTAWNFTFAEGDLTEGSNTITARATDEAGNESGSSDPFVFTLDTVTPDIANAPTLVTADDSGDSDTDNITNVNQVTVTGTVEANGRAFILINGENATGGNVGGDGVYELLLPELEDGTYEITVRSMDTAGNLAAASQTLTITIDTAAPQAPTITGDTNTNDTTPTVSGIASEDAVFVQVYVDGVANGDPVAVVDGEWTHVVEGPLTEDEFEITATAFDLAGNESVASDTLEVTVDLTAPAAPSDIELDGDSVNGISDLHTNTDTPVINGTTDGDTDTLEVFVGGQSVGFAEVNGTSWTFTFSEGDLEEGVNTITAKATDEAGNESVASADFVFTVDLTDPATPAAPDLEAGSDSNVNTDNITSDNTPTFNGTIEASGRATIFVNGEAVSGQNTDGTGVYELTLPELEDGTYEITIVTMDQAGNFSQASAPLSVTIDTAAPDAPTITGDADTSDTTPTVSGTAEAGSTVEVFIGGVSDGTVTADEEGNWSKALSQQVDGDFVITATATDLAGNESNVSNNLNIDIDTTAPAAPSTPDLIADNDSGESETDNLTNSGTITLVGTAEAGSTVTLFVSDQSILTDVADEEGNYEFVIDVGSEGDFALPFSVTATDAAGNVSDASGEIEVTRETGQPTVEVTPVEPDPREDAVESITIVFSEAVFNFTVADITLTLSGGENLLVGDESLITIDDGFTWILSDLAALTDSSGTYTLTVLADGINDEAGNTVAQNSVDVWTFNSQAPTLTTVGTFTGAIKNTPFTITYEDLADAANEADADGGDIIFKISAVTTGTLTKNDIAVTPGVTTISEGEELVWTPANNALGTLNAFTIVANDGFDDSATPVQVKVTVEKPTVSLVIVDDEGAEDGSDTLTYIVSRNGATDQALTVNLTISGTAKNGTDYTKINSTVVIAAGEESATITITPTDDSVAEVTQTVTIALRSSSAYTIDANDSTGTGTIEDNEPVVTITANDDTATEAGLTTGQFTVTLSNAIDQDLTVFYTVADTATANFDYVKLTGSVVILAGETTATITVTPKQDAKIESDETVTVTLKNNAAYTIDGNDAATVTIEDDEPTVSIEATDADASEDGLATATFTFTLSNAVDQDTKIFFRATGTARNGTDYERIGSFVIIAAGDTTATVTITPRQDLTAEELETITLTLRSSRNYALDEDDSEATATLADNEPAVSIEAIDNEADEEGLETAQFEFTRSGGDHTLALRVFFKVTGTATNGTDYDKLSSFIDIPAGEDSVILTVTPKQDTKFEQDETIIVTLTSKTTYTIDDGSADATVTILDNEPIVGVEATGPEAGELGLVPGEYTFTRTGSTASALTVFFSVSGTARSSDFNSIFSSVVILAGESSVTLALTPKTDTLVEEGETVIVTLKTNASYGIDGDAANAIVTIFDALG